MSSETAEVVDPSAHWSFETKQVHAGQTPDTATRARALPIYQTTSYTFRDTDHAAALFGLAETGNIYTRIMNPTQDVVEQRIAALEGGVAALFLASGQAAETFAILNLANAGDHIVSSPRLYGGTYNLFHYTLPKLGIDVSFVEQPDDLESWRAAVRPNTKAFFGETISNPQNDILDIPGVAAVAHYAGVPLIVDNTVATPYLIQPLSHGADIVVHSATKYLGGHSDVVGGLVVVRDEELHEGVRFVQNAIGAVPGPFDCFLVHRGLRTLHLRVSAHTENGRAVSDFLRRADGVEDVRWPGFGGMVSFRHPDATRVAAATEIFSLAESLGGVESLIEVPGPMTHASVAGSPLEIAPELIRLSVGIEHVDDLIADLERALG
jgi:O-acetylhomoserine (thiol)-lyase